MLSNTGCQSPSARKDFVLRPFLARLSTDTFESKKPAKGMPQPVSGYALASLFAIVESPISQILIFFSRGRKAMRSKAGMRHLIAIILQQVRVCVQRRQRYRQQLAVVGLEV